MARSVPNFWGPSTYCPPSTTGVQVSRTPGGLSLSSLGQPPSSQSTAHPAAPDPLPAPLPICILVEGLVKAQVFKKALSPTPFLHPQLLPPLGSPAKHVPPHTGWFGHLPSALIIGLSHPETLPPPLLQDLPGSFSPTPLNTRALLRPGPDSQCPFPMTPFPWKQRPLLTTFSSPWQSLGFLLTTCYPALLWAWPPPR